MENKVKQLISQGNKYPQLSKEWFQKSSSSGCA